VLYNNLGSVSHHFRDTVTYSLKLLLKIAAKPLQMKAWLLLAAYIYLFICVFIYFHRSKDNNTCDNKRTLANNSCHATSGGQQDLTEHLLLPI